MPDDDNKGDDNFEEPTPVQMTPLEKLEKRSKKSATDSAQALSTISMMRDELRGSIDRDEREHKRLNDGLAQVNVRVEVVRTQITALSTDVARSDGKLDILVGDIKNQKDLAVYREKAAIEDSTDEKKTRRAWNVKLLAIVGGAVTALTAGLVALLKSCG